MAKRPLVLVVDDTDDNRELYMDYLHFAGFTVVGANDGEDAIEKARSLSPCAILMDLTMPGVDGWEATRLLKSDDATRDIPILVVTGHAEAVAKKRALEAGCDVFLSKPALPASVARHVIRLVTARQAFLTAR